MTALLWRMARVVSLVTLVQLLPAGAPPTAEAQANQGATLTVLSGTVVWTPAGRAAIQGAGTGTSLQIGDRIDTLAATRALITFFEGSEVELEPESSLMLQEVAQSGATIRITLVELAGESLHRVARFADSSGRYTVQNSPGTAVMLVRGTRFRFIVHDSGRVRVICDDCDPSKVTFNQQAIGTCELRTLNPDGTIEVGRCGSGDYEGLEDEKPDELPGSGQENEDRSSTPG